LEFNATLHYTHNRENSTLSVVYVATLATPKGWVAWGINPTRSGMISSKVKETFENDDVMEIITLNIQDYNIIVPSKLAIDTWDLKAEENVGLMKIYASVKLPENSQGVNMTWQVGHLVVNGKLVIAHTQQI
jgi:hypothetical protein